MAENNIYGSSEFLLDQILSISQSSGYKHSYLIQDLERQILSIISQNINFEARTNQLLGGLVDDLLSLSSSLSDGLERASPEQTLRVRTHQLAIAKLLVFTYAKSDFRLAQAHFHQGRAYLLCKAYEQAVNHLTIASTKISKMSDIKQTKIYNSFILTTLGACYYETERYDYTLEVLLRAYDIQNSSQIQKNNFITKLTLEMLAKTYLKHRPAEDARLKKEKEEIKLKYQEEAVRLIDRLIDVLANQFVDFQNAYSKALYLAQYQRKSVDSEENIKKQTDFMFERPPNKKKGEQIELVKLIEFLEEKIETLIIDFDRNPVRSALKKLKSDDRKGDCLELLAARLRELLENLSEGLKKQRIFKFKVLLSCALVTNSTDQELKVFMKEYEEDETSKSAVKKLSKDEKIQIYKLLLSYAARFSDNQNQLQYLKKLEEIYIEPPETSQSQIELLNIRRSLSKLYTQMHMQAEASLILEEIKSLQLKLFGPTSKPVRKTQSMLKLIKRQNEYQDVNKINISKTGKTRLRKTVMVSNHAPRLLEAS